MGNSTSKNRRTYPFPVQGPRVREHMVNRHTHQVTNWTLQPTRAGPFPPQNYVDHPRSQGLPEYTFHPVPHGMVGITIRDENFRLVKPEDHKSRPHTPDPGLLPNFGIPPARSPQAALPVGAARSRGDIQGHMAGPGASSRQPRQHQSAQAKSKAQTCELGDEWSQWEPSCGMQTSCPAEEMPMATKRMVKEAGICVKGFDWTRQRFDGWRCKGCNHFVFDNQGAADTFLRGWLPMMVREINMQPRRRM